MGYWKISVLAKVHVLILLVLLLCNTLNGGEREELMEKIESLEKELQHTTDPTRMAELQAEIMQLCQQLSALEGLELPNISVTPAATPEEEVKRRCKIINTQWTAAKEIFLHSDLSGEKRHIPIASAVPIEGYAVFDGKYETKPYYGCVEKKLRYNVTEKFVGYIVITEYYDAQRKQFDKDKDFMIGSISTDIKVNSLSGRECFRPSNIPCDCEKWEHFTRYTISDVNRYGQMGEDVVGGDSENGKVTLEVTAPNVMFRSEDGHVSENIGCSAAKFKMTTEEFARLIKSGKIDLKKNLAYDECNKGSSITLHIRITSTECFIKFKGNHNGIFGCSETGGNPTTDVSLEGHLKSGTPVSYKWKILLGTDIVTFGDNRSTGKEVLIHPISYSRMPNDVVVEVDIKNNKGHTCVATCSLTVQKPSSLRMLSEDEVKSLGLKPYVNYKELCNQGHCAKLPEEYGMGNKKIIDGYKRMIVYQVLDQFSLPIAKPEMFWSEKRWVIIQGHRIDLPYVGEGNGVQVPVNPNNPNGPKFPMYSNNGITEKGGKVIDHLAVMYPEGTSGVPQGFDISVEQDIKVFGCFVRHVLQHYKESDATATYSPP